MSSSVDFLANNGNIAGGEVMLLRMARAAADMGIAVRVIGPAPPQPLGAAAEAAGLPFVPVPGADRRAYLKSLMLKSRSLRPDLLWCNGLVPGLATALVSGRRVLHLHQVPMGLHQVVARRLSSARLEATVVPSIFMASRVRGSRVLQNWTEPAALLAPRPRDGDTALVVGFIGRLSSTKGVGVLADAMRILQARSSGAFRLALAGDDRFVPSADSARISTKLAAVSGVSRMGWVDRSMFFGQVDMVVVPSTWPEVFGLVAAEAMARGLPLIVSDAGALPEVVGAGYPWISRRNDPADLADMIEAVATSPDRVALVREHSRKRWHDEFGPDVGFRRFRDLLIELAII